MGSPFSTRRPSESDLASPTNGLSPAIRSWAPSNAYSRSSVSFVILLSSMTAHASLMRTDPSFGGVQTATTRVFESPTASSIQFGWVGAQRVCALSASTRFAGRTNIMMKRKFKITISRSRRALFLETKRNAATASPDKASSNVSRPACEPSTGLRSPHGTSATVLDETPHDLLLSTSAKGIAAGTMKAANAAVPARSLGRGIPTWIQSRNARSSSGTR